jgi:hypothetical protein
LSDKLKILFLTHGVINYESDRNWYETLKKFGEVTRIDYVKDGQNRCNFYEEIKLANNGTCPWESLESYDACFFPVYRKIVPINILHDMRYKGCKVIAWHSDDNTKYESDSVYYAPHIDLNITTYRSAYDKYIRDGYPAMLGRWAANPDYYKRYKKTPKTLDISFVGQNYGTRPVIKNGLEYKYNCCFFGKGWNGPERIKFKDYIDIINSTKINLDISNDCRESDKMQIKGRVAEITMCGGFLLTGYHPELHEMFEIGKEIVCYTGLEDMLDKIDYYLKHDEEREAIADAGYKRAQRDHTYDKLFKRAFEMVGMM